MKIFLTGASGFIGGAIAKNVAQTHTVSAMSRSAQSDKVLEGIGVKPVRSELGAVESAQMAGCDVVIHCAAYVKQWGAREQFWATNVAGTEQLLRVSRAAGVTRFIQMSTEAVLFYGQDMIDIDESYPYPDRTPYLYAESKAAAEKLVIAANAPGFATLALRPRLVWGPDDQTILPEMKKRVTSGQFMWFDGGRARTSTTHIANVVHATRLALEHGRGGQAYFVTDDATTTFREFLTALLQTQGLTPPNRSIPGSVARGLAAVAESSWGLLRPHSEPPLTRLAAGLMSCACTIRTDKARRELNYEPVITREQGLTELRGA